MLWHHVQAAGHAGATMACAPVLVCNLLAPEYTQSLAALVVGFALSEMWRAPAAVMVRDVSPPSLGSTGSAVHLCIRNFVGGLGPISAPLAGLGSRVDRGWKVVWVVRAELVADPDDEPHSSVACSQALPRDCE